MSKKQSVIRHGAQQLFYTEGFKQKIIDEVLSGKLNRHQASKIYGIKGSATITYWIRQSQSVPGDFKAGLPVSNFAEMKQNIQDKKLEEENKELKELRVWPNSVPTSGSMLSKLQNKNLALIS